jgi:hypothetical protein
VIGRLGRRLRTFGAHEHEDDGRDDDGYDNDDDNDDPGWAIRARPSTDIRLIALRHRRTSAPRCQRVPRAPHTPGPNDLPGSMVRTGCLQNVR